MSTGLHTQQCEPAYACAQEVQALLDCVAAGRFSELKCLPLVKKLRRCIEQKVQLCWWFLLCTQLLQSFLCCTAA